MRAMKTQRGYNLVEMMIALTVLALVIGGALIPLRQRLQQEAINSAEKQLRDAKAAIHSFALANKTAGGRLLYFNGIEYALPSGRPYLPCPDVTGDGLEDRSDISVVGLFTTSPANHLATDGVCDEQKGMLPWKTLGVKELDPWGNRLTYRVDKKFSSRLFGFDETFHADIFDYTKEITYPGGDPEYELYTGRDEVGAVVCSELFDNTSSGGCPNLALDNVEAGVWTDADVALGARDVPAYDNVNNSTPQGGIDGPVFVVLSHGNDGEGAIGRDNKCRPTGGPLQTNNLVETVNAYYASGHPFLNSSFGCAALSGSAVDLYENMFVTQPISSISNDDVDQPDDILIWGGARELAGFLARSGALPIDKLEYLQ